LEAFGVPTRWMDSGKPATEVLEKRFWEGERENEKVWSEKGTQKMRFVKIKKKGSGVETEKE